MAEKLAEGDKAPSFELAGRQRRHRPARAISRAGSWSFTFIRRPTRRVAHKVDRVLGAQASLRQGEYRRDRRVPRPGRGAGRVQDKHGLKFPDRHEPAHKMLKAYGAWGEKSMYGRKFMGVTRSTFLIGEDGRVARVWPKVGSTDTPKRCSKRHANCSDSTKLNGSKKLTTNRLIGRVAATALSYRDDFKHRYCSRCGSGRCRTGPNVTGGPASAIRMPPAART